MASGIGSALLGGACLGVSSVVVLAQTASILGISGIVGGLLDKGKRSQPWRWAFVGGLLTGARIALQLHPASFTTPAATFSWLYGLKGNSRYYVNFCYSHLSIFPVVLQLAQATAGGLLVGAGAALGGGCTSGHGVCGVSRLSPRSLAFISMAMAAGGFAATVLGAAAAIPAAAAGATGPPSALLRLMLGSATALIVAPALTRAAAGGRQMSDAGEARLWTAVYGAAGFVFALGLSVSGMLNAANVVAFLSPSSAAFDPKLAAVMAGAVGVAVLPFQTIGSWGALRKAGVICQDRLDPPGGHVNGRLLLGAVLFGAGWGVSGMCPGPALANLVRPSQQVVAAVASMLAGMALVRGTG